MQRAPQAQAQAGHTTAQRLCFLPRKTHGRDSSTKAKAACPASQFSVKVFFFPFFCRPFLFIFFLFHILPLTKGVIVSHHGKNFDFYSFFLATALAAGEDSSGRGRR
jgi:hypothetical protein